MNSEDQKITHSFEEQMLPEMKYRRHSNITVSLVKDAAQDQEELNPAS
jgi:hypothetical protein